MIVYQNCLYRYFITIFLSFRQEETTFAPYIHLKDQSEKTSFRNLDKNEKIGAKSRVVNEKTQHWNNGLQVTVKLTR